ncbi:MAG: hypothetical protein EXR62_15145 [Chloroflexi bacterium]|nr:hypothetical protein [Chloroflexota bacterium]
MSIRKLYILISAAFLLVMSFPAVISASNWYCIGDPIITLNNKVTLVNVRFEQDALQTARQEGNPVIVKIYAPTDTYRLIADAAPYPIHTEYIYTPGTTVRFEASGPNLTNFGAYRIQLSVRVPREQVSQVSNTDQAEAPFVSLELPYSIWQ